AACGPRLAPRPPPYPMGFGGPRGGRYLRHPFPHPLHGVAPSVADAGALALSAGVDVELPTVHCYGDKLMAEVEAGRVTEEHINRAVRRVLLQKCELGLLDPDWQPEPEGDEIDLDPAEHRDLDRRLAEQSIVLLENSADA